MALWVLWDRLPMTPNPCFCREACGLSLQRRNSGLNLGCCRRRSLRETCGRPAGDLRVSAVHVNMRETAKTGYSASLAYSLAYGLAYGCRPQEPQGSATRALVEPRRPQEPQGTRLNSQSQLRLARLSARDSSATRELQRLFNVSSLPCRPGLPTGPSQPARLNPTVCAA